jgi:hypothetical protein
MDLCHCEICGARVRELRRGRCWGCYNRWVESRPVGLGASCRMCGERRRGYLKSVELLGAWVSVCHNCGGRIAAMVPLPQTVGEIRAALGRERRYLPRRVGKPDGRVFQYDRRELHRRAAESPEGVDEEMIVEIAELAHDLELLAAELPGEGADLTQIRDLPGA